MAIASLEFDYIRSLVLARSALVLEPGKEYLVESRLEPLALQEGFPSLCQLIECLRHNSFGPLHRKVVEAMATSETMFFRDLRPFEVLRTIVLPELVKKREGERILNVWCAACSTGQEPYSVAMLIREHFPAILGWTLRIIASDISRDVLARARQGSYSQLEVNRGLPAPLLLKYFAKKNDRWQLKEEVRRMVELLEINLVEPWPAMPMMDIIFMRNVLIYVGVDMKKAVLMKVRRLLRPDGVLLLGGSESTIYLDESFEPFPAGRPAVYRLRALTSIQSSARR
jgi:chemotaxis protein methyltransferase CheR